MGCDIFNHFEIQRGGRWHYDVLPFTAWGKPVEDRIWRHPAYIDRNYELFGLLGGPKGGLVEFPTEYRRGQRNPALEEKPWRWPRLQISSMPKNGREDRLHGLPHDASDALKSLWIPERAWTRL